MNKPTIKEQLQEVREIPWVKTARKDFWYNTFSAIMSDGKVEIADTVKELKEKVNSILNK